MNDEKVTLSKSTGSSTPFLAQNRKSEARTNRGRRPKSPGIRVKSESTAFRKSKDGDEPASPD